MNVERFILAVIVALGVVAMAWALRPLSPRDGFIRPSLAESEARQ